MRFVVIARWLAREGEEGAVRDALAQLAEASRAESGCNAYRVLRGVDDARSYVLYEEYADAAAYDSHLATDHFRRHALEEGIPRLESRTREFYSLLDL